MASKEKNTIRIIVIMVCLLVICFVLFIKARDLKGLGSSSKELNALNSRNATDSLILLTELATESSGDYVRAKADHIEMLRKYVKHMRNRHKPWVFVLKNDITEELKLTIKKLEKDEKEANQQMEACVKIKIASKAIAEFLNKHKLFIDEPIVNSNPEAISKKIQTAIRDSLDEAHKKTKIYVNDVNMVNSEAAYRANRKAIVYLYLVRFEFRLEWFSESSKIITSEKLRTLRGDINRTIYWNRVLERSNITEEERSRLTKCSVNELRHLRLLRGMIDNDMKEVHFWLKLAIKQAFPDVQFLVEK